MHSLTPRPRSRHSCTQAISHSSHSSLCSRQTRRITVSPVCLRCRSSSRGGASADSAQITRSCQETVPRCLAATTRGLSLLLAGSIVINTVAVPLALAAETFSTAQGGASQHASAATQLQRQPQFVTADAPDVQQAEEVTDQQQQQQQQWWQQDQQVWQELTSAAELTAYLSAAPPAWPALPLLPPRLRVLEFYAGWCPACKAAAPGMAEVAGDPLLRQHVAFARANIDRVKPLVRQLGISTIPTVLLIGPDGTVLDSLRASGQAVRDAVEVQLAALQQQQQQQQRPSLQPPVLPPAAGSAESPGADEGQPAPSDIGDGNGRASSTTNDGASSSSSSSSSTPSTAACGVTPEPSCGNLPPGIAASSSSSSGEAAAADAPAPAADDTALLAAKQQFLQQFNSQYGYSGWLEQHYAAEIGDRLGRDKHYLDYTGAALYPASLLQSVYQDLMTHSYGNPHSAGAAPASLTGGSSGSNNSSSGGVVEAAAPPAAASEAVMDAAAAAVLSHLHADPAEYQVVFTRSATDALRMVGEMFPWSSSSSSNNSAGSAQQQPASDLDMLTAGSASNQQQQVGTPDGSSSSSSSKSDSVSSSSSRSRFIYTRSNHNSVLGIGSYAAAAGAELVPQSDEGMEAFVASLEHQGSGGGGHDASAAAVDAPTGTTYSLLAYPAQDNFAGVIYPLDWINRVHAAASPSARTLVLLDAAAYLPTHELDLTAHPADFVAASAYKLFGYPTGLGFLLLRTEHVPCLNKIYFGGGSVALATPEGCWHVGKCDPAALLTDGTPNYLGAAALTLAYDSWDARGGMQAVQQHTQALQAWLYGQLSSLRHSNGAPLLQLYGRHDAADQQQQQGQQQGFSQGAIFNFQVLRADGTPISFSRIDREATAAGIYLRSGCVCNPGACYDSLGLAASEVQALAGDKEGCGDGMDFVTVMRPPAAAAAGGGSGSSSGGLWSSLWGSAGGGGATQEAAQLVPTQVPLGSVRVSLGWASTFEDVFALVRFLRGYLE